MCSAPAFTGPEPCSLKKTVLNEGSDEEKRTNEIGVFIPMMDDISDVAGRIVTVAALPTWKMIATYLHRRSAHYIFVTKGNHPDLFEVPAEWADKEFARHGRREKREIWVSTKPLHIVAFPWAEQVFAIRKTGRQAVVGKPNVEIVVGITSYAVATADAARLLSLNRLHWTIERRVHLGSGRTGRLERGPLVEQERAQA